jgi:hypothetical protein
VKFKPRLLHRNVLSLPAFAGIFTDSTAIMAAYPRPEEYLRFFYPLFTGCIFEE